MGVSLRHLSHTFAVSCSLGASGNLRQRQNTTPTTLSATCGETPLNPKQGGVATTALYVSDAHRPHPFSPAQD